MTDRRFILIVFHISGYAALIYQVVWQRVLFSIYGVHTEAVTAVVAVFMAGLGVGALVGGWLCSVMPSRRLLLFALFEFGVGLYALSSLPLFYTVERFVGLQGGWQMVAINFLVLLPPTLMMGATLPLLVSYVCSSRYSAGASVSNLYFANTLGSGIASVLTVLVLFPLFGLSRTVFVAAGLNFVVGAAVLLGLSPSRGFRERAS